MSTSTPTGLRRRLPGQKKRPEPDGVAQLPEHFERGGFDDGFVQGHGLRLNKDFADHERLSCDLDHFIGLRLTRI